MRMDALIAAERAAGYAMAGSDDVTGAAARRNVPDAPQPRVSEPRSTAVAIVDMARNGSGWASWSSGWTFWKATPRAG